MFLKTKLFLIAFLFISVAAIGQRRPTPQQLEERMKDASIEDKFDAAQQLMEAKQWMHALLIWNNLLVDAPENANYNFQAGVCQLNLNLDKKHALPYLEKAMKNVSGKRDPFDFMEDRAPLETYFYIGKAYHLNYEFDKAIEHYNKFKSEGPKKHFLIVDGEVDHQINISNNAKEYIANSHEGDYKITNIGGVINSEFSDFSPVISLGEDILFFTSRRMRADSTNSDFLVPDDGKLFEDIYFSIRNENGNWGKPHLVAICEPEINEATISVSADATRLFVYRDDNGDGNIYVSELEDTLFTELEYFEAANTESWETHITSSPDGSIMYFVSDRPGGLGGRDIYRIKRLPNGKWSEPMNLGAPVNSKYDEDAPFIHADGISLYFSANNDKSMGGFDIYVTQMNEEGKFSDPVNLGYPLNTVDDDVFFILNAQGTTGYYSSAIDGGFGEKDIYVVDYNKPTVEPVAVLKGYIRPKKGEPFPSDILIYVTDVTEGDDPKEYRPNALTQSYVLDLKPCHEYHIDYQRDGVTFHEFETQVPCDAGIGNINHEIFIDPIYLDPEDAVIVEEKSKQWHLLTKNNKLPQGDLTVSLVDENGNELFNDPVRDGFFKYRELPDGRKPIFILKVNDKPLCDEMEIELVSEDQRVIGRTIRDERCRYLYEKLPQVVENIDTTDNKDTTQLVDNKDNKDNKDENLVAKPCSYEKFYTYNKKGIQNYEKLFKELIDCIIVNIKVNGKVDMVFESSASKVPTTTYKTNENLTLKRAEDAKKMVFDALKAKGIDTSKVNIVAYSTLVQGPEYNDDWKENKETYEKYQYVKITAK